MSKKYKKFIVKDARINKTTEAVNNDFKKVIQNINTYTQDEKKSFTWGLPRVIDYKTGGYAKIKDVISPAQFKAYDYAERRFNQINSSLNNVPYGNLINNTFIGYGALSTLISSNGILNAICKTLSSEMCRKFIEFRSTGDNEEDSEYIKKLEKEFERLDVRTLYEKSLYQTFAYGGSYLFAAIGNADYEDLDNEALVELENELFIDDVHIGIGDLKYLASIEPMWVVPIEFNTTNPFSPFYYKPKYYSVMGKTTHYTRLLKFIYNEAPDIYKPTYLFNGIPLMEYCIKYVSNFETIMNAVTFIVKRYNLNVLKTDVERIITSDDPSIQGNLTTRISIFNQLMSQSGTVAIDNETEDFYQLNMQLTGLKELESQAAEYMCIVPKTPASKLLGINPQGFNSSGDYEMNSFYDLCMNLNETIGRVHLTKIMHMAMLNISGEINHDITFDFLPLKELSEKEIAEINEIKSRTDINLEQSGGIDSQDVQNRLRNDVDSEYNGLEQREREIANIFSPEFIES